MRKESELNQDVLIFARKMKSVWQMLFLPGIFIYGISLIHFFYRKPSGKSAIQPHLKNIDLVSFLIAMGLALAIFGLKRKYFSRKFSRDVIQKTLKKSPEVDDHTLLDHITLTLRQKMMQVWLLGFLLIADGVLFYWITFLTQNLHLYFIVGVFSQVLNYPRSELFHDLPWYVIEERKDLSAPQTPPSRE